MKVMIAKEVMTCDVSPVAIVYTVHFPLSVSHTFKFLHSCLYRRFFFHQIYVHFKYFLFFPISINMYYLNFLAKSMREQMTWPVFCPKAFLATASTKEDLNI